MQYGLGIDLGTTQTAAAVHADGRTQVVRLGARRAEIPSLVFVRPDGGLLIGEAAERRGQAEPARLAREFKRRIGDPVPILAGGVPFSAHALTAKLLRHVLDEVLRSQDGPPAVLTVTHPANWGPYKREQLDQALRLAETGPALLRTEPEAAALQHATARRIGPGATVAVYDLGGGTFDAAVLRREGEGFRVLGEPEGIEQLGGADFDEAVFGHVLSVLGGRVEGLDPNEPEVVTALARLRRDCVEAKEALSFDTEVMIPVALPGVHTRVRLNRSELESMIEPALADTVAALHRALRAAGVAPAELDAVLLAGGSSRIPLVGQLLATAFERPVVADPHPEHSVALGAAVATALLTGGVSPFHQAVALPPDPLPGPSVAAGSGGAAVAESAPAGPDSAVGTRTAVGGPARSGGIPPAADQVGSARIPPGDGAAPPQVMPAHDQPGATRVLPGNGGAPPTMPDTDDAGTTRVLPGDRGGPAAVAYSRGAASVPGPAADVPRAEPFVAPTRTFPQPTSPAPAAGGPAFAGRTAPPSAAGDARPAGRNGRMLVLVGALTLALIAGTTALIVLSRRGDSDRGTSSPPSASVPAHPTDGMLIQVDAGGERRPELKSSAYLLTPGEPGRTAVADSGGDVLPEWSRDRKRVAVIRYEPDGSNAIWVLDADGGNPERVVGNATGGRVSWHPDGTRLAFLRRVDGSPQIFTIRIGDDEPTQLTRAPGMKDDPAWSPGGGAIAYWKLLGEQRQIFVLNANDPEEPGRQITDGNSGPGVDPNWSPDGMRIAYTRSTGDDTSDIWVVDSDGRNPERVTDHEAREMDPSWSPDGRWLAFARGPVTGPKIVITEVGGSAERTLTEGDAREGHPCWS